MDEKNYFISDWAVLPELPKKEEAKPPKNLQKPPHHFWSHVKPEEDEKKSPEHFYLAGVPFN